MDIFSTINIVSSKKIIQFGNFVLIYGERYFKTFKKINNKWVYIGIMPQMRDVQ